MTWTEYTLPVVNDIRRKGGGSFIAEVWYIYRDQCNRGCLSLLELCAVAVLANCYCYCKLYNLLPWVLF